jgi:hypothetical protein
LMFWYVTAPVITKPISLYIPQTRICDATDIAVEYNSLPYALHYKPKLAEPARLNTRSQGLSNPGNPTTTSDRT